jgi:hypothetical protein
MISDEGSYYDRGECEHCTHPSDEPHQDRDCSRHSHDGLFGSPSW